MNLKRLYGFGDGDSMRSLPIALHFLLSGMISALLLILQPNALPLIVAFNDGTLGLSASVLAAILGVPLYMIFFVYLASTKAVLDWILDGK